MWSSKRKDECHGSLKLPAALVMVMGMRAMGEVGSILEKELLGLLYSGIKEQEESNL